MTTEIQTAHLSDTKTQTLPKHAIPFSFCLFYTLLSAAPPRDRQLNDLITINGLEAAWKNL